MQRNRIATLIIRSSDPNQVMVDPSNTYSLARHSSSQPTVDIPQGRKKERERERKKRQYQYRRSVYRLKPKNALAISRVSVCACEVVCRQEQNVREPSALAGGARMMQSDPQKPYCFTGISLSSKVYVPAQ